MTPILCPATETQFDSNGIGIMADAVSCKVTEELNGGYELVMQYPIDGIHYGEIQQRCILYCDANTGNKQPFRVYRITKPHKGIVTIYAAHISYDLSGIPVKPFTAGSAAGAMTALETGAAVASPFTFWTDKTNAGNLTVATPLSSRFVLGGGDNSIINVYGGELEFDRYTVRLHNERGIDRGVSIRYGKNLTSLEQDENNANVYTGVYPYYADGDGNLTQLDEVIVPAPGTYDYEKILPLDLSAEFEETPTQAQLKAAAESYIEHNNIGIPEISLVLSFAQLDQTEEYKDKALLERVYLGDTVSVEFAALGVSAKAKCVKTVYNVLVDRYDAVELGNAKQDITGTNAKQQQAINAVASQPVSTAVQAAISAATALITGNKGGYVILHSTTGDKQPDEILIMDTPDIETAVNVWRWNNSGLGYSSKGYEGPYETAITQDGQIVADFITAGGMDAARVTAGILSSADGRVQFDLTAGTLYIKNASGTTKLGFDANGNLTVRGTIYATAGEFAGTLKSVSGSFTNLTSTGSISFRNGAMEIGYFQGDTWIDFGGTAAISGGSGRIDMVANSGVYISECDLTVDDNIECGNLYVGSRLYMYSPPSASSSANVRLVDQGSYYSLGLISSSKRYKKNIHDIREFDNVSERIDRVPAVTYSPRSGMEKDMNFYGFIAEDMETEFPWLVEYSKDETGAIQAETVYYDRTPAILWADAQNTHEILREQAKTIKEQYELIMNLNERLIRLEGDA